MILTGLFGLLLAGLIILHMTRPRFTLREMSAARFFKNFPKPEQKNNKIKFSNPLKSLPLYLQFPLLLLLLWANISSNVLNSANSTADQMGIWVMLDTSASMGTSRDGITNLQNAQATLIQAIDIARRQAKDLKAPVCARLTAYDLESRGVVPSTGDLDAITSAAEKLSFRLLGTDLTIIQTLLEKIKSGVETDLSAETACPITHVLVLSDMPAPEWASQQEFVRLIWQDISEPVDNSGMVNIQALRDSLTGKVYQVTINLIRYGLTEPARTIRITGPDGNVFSEVPVEWGGDQAGRGSFIPSGGGLYRIHVLPEDAYPFDDDAFIQITSWEQLQVDWQVQDRSMFNLLPWQQENQNPNLRIVQAGANFEVGNNVPTLFVGPGYTAGEQSEDPIVYFLEGNPLIRDLNFDVAEKVGNANQPIPRGFLPVLTGAEHVWSAYRQSPLSAYVPGLPQGDGNLRSFSTTLFFNAVRFLVQSAPQPPLYTLTTPEQPVPVENRITLFEDEGNTARVPVDSGDLTELRPAILQSRKEPVWPLWVAAASILLLVERLLFAFGGHRWQ